MDEDKPDEAKRPSFDYRAAGAGAAIAPLSFGLLHDIDSITQIVVAGSVLLILVMAFASLALWRPNAPVRDAGRRKKISLAFDSFVNAVFGHGLAFVLVRFVFQIIHRFF